MAAFLEWIAAGNPLTRRPFAPKEDPMILDALRTLAQMGVLSPPDQFPRVAVLSAPPAGGDISRYLWAIHTLSVHAYQGESSPIRPVPDAPTGGPPAFQLWPKDADHEKVLRDAITPAHPQHRDRYGVPILRGSMIRVAPAPGCDRTVLPWVRLRPGEPSRPLAVPGDLRLLVLKSSRYRTGHALIVWPTDFPEVYHLECEDLPRTEVIGSGLGTLPADSAPRGL